VTDVKWWQNFHFWVNYHFKFLKLLIASRIGVHMCWSYSAISEWEFSLPSTVKGEPPVNSSYIRTPMLHQSTACRRTSVHPTGYTPNSTFKCMLDHLNKWMNESLFNEVKLKAAVYNLKKCNFYKKNMCVDGERFTLPCHVLTLLLLQSQAPCTQ